MKENTFNIKEHDGSFSVEFKNEAFMTKRSKYKNNYLLEELFRQMSGYFRADDHEINEKQGKEGEFWPFIPFSYNYLVDQLVFISEIFSHENKQHLNFLDAGCGIGNVLFMARHIFNDMDYSRKRFKNIHGIELDPFAAKMARVMTVSDTFRNSKDNSARRVFNSDILKFRHYKKYNVVYFYCPIRLSPLQKLWEEMLEDTVKVGTFIIPNLKKSNAVTGDERFKPYYLKTDSGSQYGRFIRKVSKAKRRVTNIDAGDRARIPEKYLELFDNHIKGLKFVAGGYH